MATYTVLFTDEEDPHSSVENFAKALQQACDEGDLPGDNFLVTSRVEDDGVFWGMWRRAAKRQATGSN